MHDETPSPLQLPIARSTPDAAAVARVIEIEYGLSTRRCHLIKPIVNDTFHVLTSAGPFIFKVYGAHRRTDHQIQAELEMVTYLHAAGVPVARPVERQSGELLLSLDAPEGRRYAVLFTYASGQPMTSDDPILARLYGQITAQIHLIADTFPWSLVRPTLDSAHFLDQPLATIDDVFAHRASDLQILHDLADLLRGRIDALPRHAPAFGFCHGDIDPANIHFAVPGQATVFDFDFCGFGWRAYDIGTFIENARFYSWSAATTHAFIDGYHDIRPLDAQERQAIALFDAARDIYYLGVHAALVNECGSYRLPDPGDVCHQSSADETGRNRSYKLTASEVIIC
jgi:Ser/Thr protein kinase RdoA (MazF antagonist)